MKMQRQLYYGADYNPEQWSKEVILEDMRLMKEAGVNYVSINIFGWVNLQPDESTYDFDFLDWLMDLLYENNIMIDLANGTASPPAWLVQKHPEMLPVTIHGNRLVHGARQHYCPTSPIYRQYATDLSEAVANRYANHPGLVMWHINNEYTCHIHECYCDHCRKRFQTWLAEKYQTIAGLNDAWSTKFWSQSYGSWEEIFLPEAMPTFKNPAQQLDYRRFLSDMNLELYQLEKAAIAKSSQGIPYMTNLMGLHKYVDGFKWAPEMDVVSWNSYPNPFEKIPYPQFLANDLTRSLKKKPFLIMEQATSAVNWRQINGAKTPNQLRLWSYEALAHGADGIMFFQWRQSRGGAEKFHSAMVPHGDPHSSRIFRECAQLGNEFSQLSEIVGTRFLADVAVVFDWENWWALELDAKPSTLKYIHQLRSLYGALRALNLNVDFVHPSESLDGYPLVIAPNLYSAPEAFGKKINDYVRQGGIFLTNFFSGIVNEYDQVYLGGYPGLFRDTLGIIVEEFYPMKAAIHHQIDFQGRRYDNSLWEEVIHLNGAKALATFQSGYLSDKPAITMNQIDDGYAYYVGTELSLEGLTTFLATILENHKLATHAQHFLAAPTEVSVTCRKGAGYTLVFFLNHTEQTTKVKLKAPGADLLTKETRQLVVLKPKEVAVLKYVD